MTARCLALLAAALLLGGCGGGAGRHDVTLWVTRDRGAHLLKERTVSSGATAAQALEGVAKVQTAYGGDFVEGIDGLASGDHRDWFFYVNGYASDRGAADYVLHQGDVEWWDFRTWRDPREAELVVGAFPEPFLHGFAGRTRPGAVRFERPGDRSVAQALGRAIHARSVAAASVSVAKGWNELLLTRGALRFTMTYRAGHGTAGDPVLVVVGGSGPQLAADVHHYAHVYAVR